MHIDIILNTSNQGAIEAVRRAVEAMREGGNEVHPHLTFEPGDARRFARDAASAAADLVVAGGGDGTVNEVVNGIHDWLHGQPDGEVKLPRLAIIPLGTGNDLAGSLGIPHDPEAALEVALGGRCQWVDVAKVNGRYFLNVSTGGMGAEATDETSDELKRVLGPVAYAITGLRKFVALDTSRACFTSDGEVLYDGEFMIFAVGNAKRTGGGNWITAEADLSDGLLDLCIVERLGHLEVVRIAPQIRAGNHVHHPKVVYQQVREVTVESDVELAVNADGEPLTARRFEYAVGPRRLALMVPAPAEGGDDATDAADTGEEAGDAHDNA